MYVFEVVIALLLAGAGLTALSRRIGAPYPAMVALAGAALALVPGTPTLVLEPELALTLFVAPVLLDAAFDSSARDLRANWRTVAGLAVGAVALTIVVVAGTLVVQGLTLRPLIGALRLRDDGSVEREVRLARVETLRAALSATAGAPGDDMSGVLRRRYEVLLRRAEAEQAGDTPAPDGGGGADGGAFGLATAVARTATSAERRRLVALREDGTIGDAAFQRVEQELDLEELELQQLSRADETRAAS